MTRVHGTANEKINFLSQGDSTVSLMTRVTLVGVIKACPCPALPQTSLPSVRTMSSPIWRR